MTCSDNVLTTQFNNSTINLKEEVLTMTTTLQIRIDEELKQQATKVYENLGMDLSTAIRVFLKKSVALNGMPFMLGLDKVGTDALIAMRHMQEVSRLNGNDKMTLDEINQEIEEARKARKARERGK